MENNNENKQIFEKTGKLLDEAVSKVAEKTITAAKGTLSKARENYAIFDEKLDNLKDAHDMQTLKPFFDNDLHSSTFIYPKLIRIIDSDAKRAKSNACAGSIGFHTDIKTADNLLNIYTRFVNNLDLPFDGVVQEGFYFLNPNNIYVNLDDYFSYMNKKRIDELERIAQELGATKVEISLKSKKKTFVKNDGKAVASAGKRNNITISHEAQTEEYEKIEILNSNEFIGHEPNEPTLVYLKNEGDILNLIKARMENDIKSKTYSMVYGKSLGMSLTEAANVDAVLKAVKCSGNYSIQNETQEQHDTTLEYHIEF